MSELGQKSTANRSTNPRTKIIKIRNVSLALANLSEYNSMVNSQLFHDLHQPIRFFYIFFV